MNEVRVSAFLLERYHIGEVTDEEKCQVEEAVSKDESLAKALAELDYKDDDFYQRFPFEIFFPTSHPLHNKHHVKLRRNKLRMVPRYVWGICAAALVLIAVLPLMVIRNPVNEEFEEFGERMKGAVSDNSSIELSIYLRESFGGDIIRLSDNAGIREGNTIQLAYRVTVTNTNTDEKHGVIFSIDGRSLITMHYPYSQWQSTLLVSGRLVPLAEAFTLDDAPDYEIFFFVVGDAPLDVMYILNNARYIASQIKDNPQDAFEIGTAVFKDYELMVFTLIKEE